MDVDENSVVYVPTVPALAAPPDPSPFSQVPPPSSDPRKAISPDRDSEISLVPSSVSDEKELDSSLHVERKDPDAVKEAVDYWRQEALPLSPRNSSNSPVELRTQPHSEAISSVDADWSVSSDSASNVTPSRCNATATANMSIPTPPSTDGLEDTLCMSPVKVLDPDSKAEQIIAEIRARALAQARSQEPSSPLSDIASIDSSDEEEDEYDSLAILGLNESRRAGSPVKATGPVQPVRYNLRHAAPKVETKPKSLFPIRRDAPPSPARRKPNTANPLDALLKEKRAADAKGSMASTDREARLRELANMNLNDFDKDGDLTIDGFNDSVFGADDENPFLDDNQKREVKDILKGDKVIEDEEEHLRQQGSVGVALWGVSESDSMDDLDQALPLLEYQGSDPTLRTFVETVAHGDHNLTRLLMQSGILEMADYSGGGGSVIEHLIKMALSYREDDLDRLTLQLIPHILSNDTVETPVLLFDNILSTLCALGIEASILDKLAWVGHKSQRRGASDPVRSEMIQRLVICTTDVAISGRLQRREIPDIVAVLLLIGNEPSVSQELRLQVSRTIHLVCQSLGQENTIETDIECAISNQVLRLVQPYNVQNKVHAVSLIASGAGRTARIARVVAHAMLTDKSALLPSQYSALPPISELLDMLNVSSPDAPRPSGKFEYHEATDYVDMACWTALLAIAVTDIASYMELDESTKQLAGSLSQTPSKEEESVFETLHQKLKRIHDRIQDTRAAHLDRSQTKAILIHTHFRILYQSRAIAQYRRKRSGKIHNYMDRK